MFNSVKIFTLSTNNYKDFNESFLTSFNNLLLPSFSKEFFIFTDFVENPLYKNFNVKPFYINHESWPMITLKRYHCMNLILDQIKDNDLCIFADIDLEVVKPIESLNINNFFGVEHPGNTLVNNKDSLEDNTQSLAFVDKYNLPSNYKYIQGCLWGGVGKDFINMIITLKENTEKDFISGIVAKWHDESHLNRFCVSNINNFNILSSSYAYPENWTLPMDKIIIHKDKNMHQYPRFQGK